MSVTIRVRRNPGGTDSFQADVAGVAPDGQPFRVRLAVPRQVTSRANAQRWGEEQRRRLERGDAPATRRAALRAQREAEERAAEQAQADALAAVSVADAAAWWVEDGEVERLSPVTLALRRRLVRDYIGPTVGDCRIRDLTDRDLHSLRASLAGCSTGFARMVHIALRNTLRAAAKRGVVAAVEVRMPRGTKAEDPRAYDAANFEALLEAARQFGPRHAAVVLLCGEAGLRCGELLGLQVADAGVAADTGVLLISRSRVRVQNREALIVKAPKTGKARRVPLSDRCREVLGWLAQWRASAGRDAWLLTAADDETPATESTVRQLLGAAQRRAGVPQVGPHALRHTALTHLLAAGSDLRTVQTIAGHSSVATTARYLHALPEQVAKAATQLEAWRLGARGTSPALAPARRPKGRAKPRKDG